MVLTAYFVLSPATGLSCHRHRADTSAQLDTSVGASGPHDFAVRLELRSSARRQSVHRIPHPTFVTTAKRPSYRGRDGAESAADLGVTATRAACDRLTRRAICAWRLCANCPSGESVDVHGGKPHRHSGMRRLARTRNPCSRRAWPLGHSRKLQKSARRFHFSEPHARAWLWIPGSRFARPGMTITALPTDPQNTRSSCDRSPRDSTRASPRNWRCLRHRARPS
jgi:hypothetical protein